MDHVLRKERGQVLHDRMVDLPWQSTNKQSLAIMLRYAAGLLEIAACCAKPPYLLAQHQLTVRQFGLPGAVAAEILNKL
jgi:hypothetical protein